MTAIDDIAHAHTAVARTLRGVRPDLAVTAYGIPAPQGSKRHVGNGRLIESSKRVKPWREAVRLAAHEVLDATGTGPLDGPLAVELTLTVVKPASAPKRRTTWPITRSSGDLDKLIRSTFDALTDAKAIADDSRIVEVTATKVYPGEGYDALERPGAVIRVWRIGGGS
ncbi:RusA family crossover junction endodeoxyribonuclease [Embleya sp. NPDC005971]|uniref:RusA family crossover junction endodeoxyribonuclease n=1 Tax=Embleya sp. NPDC005971 TaxID=3156724 RepID=UPI003406FB42